MLVVINRLFHEVCGSFPNRGVKNLRQLTRLSDADIIVAIRGWYSPPLIVTGSV
jgi:hypothetical protein